MPSRKNAIHANRRDSPPVWFPPLAPGWKQALSRIESRAYGDEENRRLVYPLPPIHLFHKSENEKMGEKIHNWLRLRLWCLIQVITPPEHRMVSMRTSQWRIALEGRYYAVKYQWPKGVRPQASSSDIDRLPSPPPTIKKARLDSIPVRTPAQVHTRQRALDQVASVKAAKRLAERADVHVRFGIFGGFGPYDPSSVFQWGDMKVDRRMADKDEVLWREIVWELSILNFRLEFLQLDRDLVPEFHPQTDESLAAEREAAVFKIWGEGLRPMWEQKHAKFDELTSTVREVRIKAVKLMSLVVRSWPGGKEKLLPWNDTLTEFELSWTSFEESVFEFYIETFLVFHGRLPHIPLDQPPSILLRS